MARPLLLAAACLALVAALAGCGNRTDEPRTFAETEGIYVELGELKYQIQLSRQLNPNDPEDEDYLKGLPEGTPEPSAEEAWFAIFMRVENDTEETHEVATDFEIIDTQENNYSPVALDPEISLFDYEPRPLGPGELLPELNTTAAGDPIRGALLLFKLPYDAFQNRPLEFRIQGPDGDEGVIDIDV